MAGALSRLRVPLLRRGCPGRSANFIEARREPNGEIVHTNTFILSSWYPTVVTAGPNGARGAESEPPRLVTYGAKQQPSAVVGTVRNACHAPGFITRLTSP